MDDRDQLVLELEHSRARIMAVAAELDPQRRIYPPWTVRHLLAHITGWDEASISSLKAHAGGQEPATPAVRGIDHYNAESVSTREALDYPHIYQEWLQAREFFKAAIRNLPPEKLDTPMLLPWGQTGTARQLVRIMSHHEAEHAEEIRGLLAEWKQPAGL